MRPDLLKHLAEQAAAWTEADESIARKAAAAVIASAGVIGEQAVYAAIRSAMQVERIRLAEEGKAAVMAGRAQVATLAIKALSEVVKLLSKAAQELDS